MAVARAEKAPSILIAGTRPFCPDSEDQSSAVACTMAESWAEREICGSDTRTAVIGTSTPAPAKPTASPTALPMVPNHPVGDHAGRAKGDRRGPLAEFKHAVSPEDFASRSHHVPIAHLEVRVPRSSPRSLSKRPSNAGQRVSPARNSKRTEVSKRREVGCGA
ncbi:MAG: hypothetical protein AAGA56_17350, partial [Myxococcota bacterium]